MAKKLLKPNSSTNKLVKATASLADDLPDNTVAKWIYAFQKLNRPGVKTSLGQLKREKSPDDLRRDMKEIMKMFIVEWTSFKAGINELEATKDKAYKRNVKKLEKMLKNQGFSDANLF